MAQREGGGRGKGMSTTFSREQPVQFTSPKRDNRTWVGVVVSGPSGKHDYYEVRCTDDRSYRVPAQMLKPAKLTPAQRGALLAAGERFLDNRDANAAAREAAVIRAGRSHIERHAFAPGAVVQNRGTMGWPKVVILAVERDSGKCVVTNWKAGFRDRLLMAGITDHGRLARAKDSVTVYANRLHPID